MPLANLYSAFANDLHEGASRAPTFNDSAWIHRLLQSARDHRPAEFVSDLKKSTRRAIRALRR